MLTITEMSRSEVELLAEQANKFFLTGICSDELRAFVKTTADNDMMVNILLASGIIWRECWQRGIQKKEFPNGH